jgi:hypothetical protein
MGPSARHHSRRPVGTRKGLPAVRADLPACRTRTALHGPRRPEGEPISPPRRRAAPRQRLGVQGPRPRAGHAELPGLDDGRATPPHPPRARTGVQPHPSGDDIVLAVLGAGDYFGEVGLVHGRPRMATVRALTEVEALTLDIEGFRSLLSESDRTNRQIATVISERLAAGARRSVAPVSTARPLPVQSKPADRRGG